MFGAEFCTPPHVRRSPQNLCQACCQCVVCWCFLTIDPHGETLGSLMPAYKGDVPVACLIRLYDDDQFQNMVQFQVADPNAYHVLNFQNFEMGW